MSSILPLLNKLVPVGLALKGLEKIDPRLKTFFSGAFAAGYGADEAMNFLRSKFESPESERLEEGAKKGSLRPDEAAGLQAVRKSKNVSENIQKGVALGAGAAGGIASLLSGKGSQAIKPEVLPALKGKPKQLGAGKAPLQIEEKLRAKVPAEGEVIVPPASPNQQQDAGRISALKKFNEQKQKKSLMEQEQARFQAQYGAQQAQPAQQQGQDPNGLLLQALQELKKLRGQ